ncbi:MAG: sensor domain-containing diguanylate cyclase [Treponema sp.]|nr:sensor domain-containing diguanylate cyclase [Treponema sp.]
MDKEILEQSTYYEKRIYDLEQLIDIAKSFCSTLDFSNLLESIVYICMAQMHVLGAEIFVRDPITNDVLNLETAKAMSTGKKLSIPVGSSICSFLLESQKPVTFAELKTMVTDDDDSMQLLANLNPTLIVPLIEKNNHLSGILILQERIAIEDETTYTEYEQNMIMSIASLATVAINNASLMEMSSTDMMTHLRLKYFFFNQLTEAIDKAFELKENIAVLMFDIDFFKKFNDTYGHECGDFVLITVANIIKSSLRETDIASRYGGEEFTVLLRKGNKTEAMKVAERIRKKIEGYDFVYNDQHLHVTVSGGVSVFDTEKNPVDLPNIFVNQADSGLYMSKNNGRNQITFFDPAVHKLKESNE